MTSMIDSQEPQIELQRVADEARIAIDYLMTIREKLGIKDTTQLGGTIQSSQTSNMVVRRFAKEIYKVWASLYPVEHKDFIKTTKIDLDYERPIQESIKGGGYSPIAFPMRLERMFGALMKGVKVQDKRFWIPLLKEIPELQRSNYLKG